jgi:uncharacterized protein (TIGR02117 family)
MLLMALLLPITAYLSIAFLLMLFPAPTTQHNEQATTSYISVTRNLAHSNIMLDLSRTSVDWHSLLPDLIPEKQGYLLVGWGDQQLYQLTPTWADLKPSVALRALFTNTSAFLHLHYLPANDYPRDETITLHISATTSQAIEQHILQTFHPSTPQLAFLGYDKHDRFYYASGIYNIFTTCNTWVGRVLRQSGVSISWWTPFSYNITHSIPDRLKTHYQPSPHVLKLSY